MLQPKILNIDDLEFPPVEQAMKSPNGLLAVGGDLSPTRLLAAYSQGIFPWYSDDEPILWWSPDPRGVLFFDDLHISKDLEKHLRKRNFQISFDQAFEDVIRACAEPRKKHPLTWITPEMMAAYCELHRLGFAHSLEVWQNDQLIGGIYGVWINEVFCGESMFSRVSNASKIALVFLIEYLKEHDAKLLDCQLLNPFLESMGAREIPRREFLKFL